jgi:uncharacterized protein (UPF0264 family)
LQLLVSVREPLEVAAALLGGADIIDAKDPARGSLGPVEPATLERIAELVPEAVPLSVALGEVASAAEVRAAIGALGLRPRAAPVYLKLAPAVQDATELQTVLVEAVRAAAAHRAAPSVIVVEYADRTAHSRGSMGLRAAAMAAGVRGMLLDTAAKDGQTLLDRWSETRLQAWSASVKEAGLLAALAGSLGVAEVALVAALGCDVIGVRGAACAAGRSGLVEARKVRLLRQAIGRHAVTSSRTATVP